MWGDLLKEDKTTTRIGKIRKRIPMRTRTLTHRPGHRGLDRLLKRLFTFYSAPSLRVCKTLIWITTMAKEIKRRMKAMAAPKG